MSLGELVRELRQRRGWTQEQLAEATDMDQTSISQIETGRTLRPSYERMLALAAALEVPVADLLRAAGLAGDLAQNGHVDGSDRRPGILGRAHEKLLAKLERDIRKELEVIEEEDGEAAADDLAEIMAGAYSSNTRAILATRRRERERQRAMKT